MFDLDRLADFDRGLAAIAPAPALSRDPTPPFEAPDQVRGVARCTMVSNLGVEPLCPFARMEHA